MTDKTIPGATMDSCEMCADLGEQCIHCAQTAAVDLRSELTVTRAALNWLATEAERGVADNRLSAAIKNAFGVLGGDEPEQEPAKTQLGWGTPVDPERERLRSLTIDECDGCGPNGVLVRYCPIHGLNGTAPR